MSTVYAQRSRSSRPISNATIKNKMKRSTDTLRRKKTSTNKSFKSTWNNSAYCDGSRIASRKEKQEEESLKGKRSKLGERGLTKSMKKRKDSNTHEGTHANPHDNPHGNVRAHHPHYALKPSNSEIFKFSRRGFILSFTGNMQDFYTLSEEPLGKGTYGSVYKATDKLLKIHRAVKVVSKKKLKNVHRFRQEIDIMKNLDHPNVIKLLETFEDSKQIYLVMELCTGGELFDRIVKKGPFSEMYTSFIMKQIFSVLNYLHIRNICHRDVKPENFLFFDKSPESLIKVIDFGLASYFTDTNPEMKTKAGTPYYVAPQVLSGCYDYKCDLWSAGVLFYILLCGYPPFYGESDHEILIRVKSGKFNFKGKEWTEVTEEARDLIKHCLTMDPQKRTTASEALRHPWFNKKASNFNLDFKMDIHVLENFKNYALMLRFQKLAMTIIAQQSNDYDVQKLKAAFLHLDEEGKGNITKVQLRKGLEKSNLMLPHNFDLLLDQIDSDGSGNIEYTEFLAAAIDRRKLSKKLIYCAFRVFDVDNDGEITTAELAHILFNGNRRGNITEKDVNQVKKMIREVDKNGDGKIDFYEFSEMMKLTF
ncbi:calcium-dependent protein kinase 3, putative [Plasmodium knowlesi strain H]|uniref:Calcium-dependent protein kinase 3 n=3 Tax=Plasmodium knowlesi TaxID=5850 RepID=A0A5K1TWG9_PLAKH|nr:calcium-dependent protein kinase 3, putative [Plasmodium knowlesi strain H]OTN65906.1 putative Calcium-dependent protein kinase 3 [Plasmodium knowlesi]CAA9987967.1 calcium-dependent protein kinase 3, putative [Plasmodium knowlesi strain H]SBO22138.1 calcium-dependent protein kinase 3, putative [Plasmodium knowlesi strain H]SBO29176.1 calcium-dependent protein kinase 3, putative [Plasmodium knowlesi strain H]VVS77441.1 calcium-dependent protein kinase 3, putative [Plasmodium knowlesi strain |eukprot:XP_002258946.1 Calcium-dependent protein kinase 3, putative [Plasmodium knowlesi strain H]